MLYLDFQGLTDAKKGNILLGLKYVHIFIVSKFYAMQMKLKPLRKNILAMKTRTKQ